MTFLMIFDIINVISNSIFYENTIAERTPLPMNDLLSRIKDNVSKVIIGKEHVTGLLLAALAAGGHVLLEDVP